MKISQLLHAMDKDDEVIIDDFNNHIDNMTVYNGVVRGIQKDNPINKMHVISIAALGDVFYVLAEKPKERV